MRPVYLGSERGSAILALLIAMALGVLVVSGLTTSMIETQLADRSYRSAQAFYQAEAGYHHAISALAINAVGISDALTGPDLVAGTADDGYVLGTSPVALGDGNYIARVVDNDDGDANLSVDTDGTVYLWIRGRARAAERAVRVTLDLSNGSSLPPGLYANGDIRLASNNNVTGPGSRVHANGDLDISGGSNLVADASAVGSAVVATGASINGQPIDSAAAADEFHSAHSNKDPISIPPVDPYAYEHLADYRLTSDGRVLDASGAFVADGNSGWNGWGTGVTTTGEMLWKMKDIGPIAATIFVEGSVDISAAVSDDSQNVSVVSIVATGDIKISGRAQLRGHHEDFLAVAGGDFKMSGDTNATQFFGTVYVHEQFQMSGTAALEGSVVVGNHASERNVIFSSEGPCADLSGQATIRFTGEGPGTGGNQGAVASDWYEDSALLYKAVFR